jgi:tetratricopeptide (TPR) repeat protein
MRDTLELWSATYPQDSILMADLANHLTWIGEYTESAAVAARAVAQNEANSVRNGITVEIAARAFKHLGMYDKALTYYDSAVQHQVDTPAIHGIALQIAALRHDAKEVEHQIAWSRNTTSESQILQQAAMTALADGHARDSERLFTEATNAARRDHLEAGLATIDAYRPRILVDMGLSKRAKELADAFKADDTYMDRLFTEAEVGDPAQARAVAMSRQKEAPQDTLVNVEYAPSVYAALALHAGKPAEAVSAMSAVESYELRDPTIPYLRGQSFLAAGMGAEAAAEFKKLIDNPGIDDPLTPLHALAHLNLARALKLENKIAEARAEYALFLSIWSNADPDLPPLKEARTEWQQLAAQK